MSLSDRLRALADALPADGSVVLTAATLRAWLEEERGPAMQRSGPVSVDLTVPQVAEMLKRKPSTIRGWLDAERIPEAYKLNRREWRVPPAALQRFLDEQRSAGAERKSGAPTRVVGRSRPADLGAWRKVRRAGGAR